MYMVYRVAEKEIPSDPHAFLRVMNGFMEFKERNSMLFSLLSWVEKFGGNTALLQSQIGELDEVRLEAYDAYLTADLDEAIEVLERGRSQQIYIRDAAMRAKDKALIWVYMIEWFSLISTLMISGYILWTLMVKRRMYREAGVTRWN